MADISRSIGNLFVNIGAKTKELDDGVDESNKKLKALSGVAASTIKAFAKLGAVATATGAAVYAISASAVSAGRDIENLAYVSRESTREFQRQAFAVGSVNIEQEKYADILKDVNDRVGDFVATGGGPMADFFDRIAPKVGITADNFRDLSGSDALQLYVSSLEKANLNQQDMTFFMEAMASDATQLLPLFKNNGAELKRLGDEAERLGLIIDDVDLARLAAHNPFAKINKTLSITRTMIGVELVPIVDALANKFFAFAEEQGGVGEMIRKSMAKGAVAVSKVSDAVHVLDFGFTGIQLLAASVGAGITATFNKVAIKLAEVSDWGTKIENKFRRRLGFDEVELVGESDFMVNLQNASDRAFERVEELKGELDKIALSDYPSEKVLQFFKDIDEGADQAGMKTRSMFAGLNIGGSTDGTVTGGNEGNGLESPGNSGMNLDDVKEKYLQLEELEKLHLEEMDLIGEEFDAAKFEKEEQWRQAKLAAEEDYWTKRKALTSKNQKGLIGLIQNFWGTNVSETAKSLGTMFQAFGAHSRKMFEAQKAWGIADAVMSMWQGVAAGLRLGWPMAVPAVGYALAQGATAINNIRSQSFGGGGGSAAGGGAVSAASAPEATQPQPAQQQESVTRRIFVDMPDDARLDKRAVASLLQEAIDDGTEFTFS